MPKTVWKQTFHLYQLVLPEGKITLSLPNDARPLQWEVASDDDQTITFWYETSPNTYAQLRDFYVYPTGHVIPDDREHVATLVGRIYVWHVYKAKPSVADLPGV